MVVRCAVRGFQNMRLFHIIVQLAIASLDIELFTAPFENLLLRNFVQSSKFKVQGSKK